MSVSLSVVIPAYNEAERLGSSLDSVVQFLKDYPHSSELIVVDDGSVDDTVLVARQALKKAEGFQTRLIQYQPNRGKGFAVRTGLLAARAPIALFSDADLSTPITEIPKLVRMIERNECDVAFGSRTLDRKLIGIRQPWRRELGGRVFNRIVRLITRLPASDTQCGFKAFRMETCRPLLEAAKIDRFAFDVELLYLAQLAGLRIRDCAVRWDHFEGSKVSFMRDSVRMFSEVLAIRQRARKGQYDLALNAARQRALSLRRRRLEAGGRSSRLQERLA
ncbi:MAG TPA: dolichyl-phosphate beta-glucosyltransferase [Planctomycetota bacterium]|nr:dolichyl-phosphate beta-glucosyltransferase [Planctomycetota bacterium]